MAADPTLADRLDEMADDVDSIDAIGGQTAGDAADLRAAAVRLRKLDAIEGAAGDRFDLEGFAVVLELRGQYPAIARRLRRIADALGGTE